MQGLLFKNPIWFQDYKQCSQTSSMKNNVSKYNEEEGVQGACTGVGVFNWEEG